MDNKYNYLIPNIHYFVERKGNPNWYITEAVINFCDLTYVIGGEAVYTVNDEDIMLKKGDLIFINKGSKRMARTKHDNPIHCYAINFEYEFVGSEFVQLPFGTKLNIGLNSEIIKQLELFNSIWLEKQSNYYLLARGIFMQVLRMLIYTYESNYLEQATSPHVEKIKKYILNNFTKKITVVELSKMLELHPVYVGSHFKQVSGISINEYINKIRINKAAELLSTGGYSVTEVALTCGFEDVFYFSKVFKKNKGMSPVMYKSM